MLTATVEKVKFGSFKIEGLMDEEGSYYVAIPQLSALSIVPPNRSAKQLEDLTDKAFSSHELVKLKTILNSKPVNALPIIKFEALLFNLSLRENAKAIEDLEQLKKKHNSLKSETLARLTSNENKLKKHGEHRDKVFLFLLRFVARALWTIATGGSLSYLLEPLGFVKDSLDRDRGSSINPLRTSSADKTCEVETVSL